MQERHWGGRYPGTASGFEQLLNSALQEQFQGTEHSDSSLHPEVSAGVGGLGITQSWRRAEIEGEYHQVALQSGGSS